MKKENKNWDLTGWGNGSGLNLKTNINAMPGCCLAFQALCYLTDGNNTRVTEEVVPL